MSKLFGKNLKKFRENEEVYQQELANFLKVHKATVSSWETAKTEPTLDMLNKIADFFNVSIDELLGRQKNVAMQINSKEQQALTYFKLLSDRLQSRALGYLQALADEFGKEGTKDA